MSSNKEFFEALTVLSKEKGMDTQILLDKIQTALILAIKKDFPGNENISFNIDFDKGRFDVIIQKRVAEVITDEANEITIEQAAKYTKRKLSYGDIVQVKLDPKTFGRIAITTAKQVITQGIKETEKAKISEQWGVLQNELVSATVLRIDLKGNATVKVNDNEHMLSLRDQIPGEILRPGDIIKVFVCPPSAENKNYFRLSRTDKGVVKRLFENEVPEIFDGTVEIKAISREAGSRSKVAVVSNNPDVDALGACIGPARQRISKICEELHGEKMDVVLYSDNAEEFIAQALKPSDVIRVEIPDESVKACTAIVPDNQLSLAIGNKGQNAKLAAKLTGFKIDIRPQSGFFEAPDEE